MCDRSIVQIGDEEIKSSADRVDYVFYGGLGLVLLPRGTFRDSLSTALTANQQAHRRTASPPL